MAIENIKFDQNEIATIKTSNTQVEGRSACRKQLKIEPLDNTIILTIENGYANNIDLQLVCTKSEVKKLFESLY